MNYCSRCSSWAGSVWNLSRRWRDGRPFFALLMVHIHFNPSALAKSHCVGSRPQLFRNPTAPWSSASFHADWTIKCVEKWTTQRGDHRCICIIRRACYLAMLLERVSTMDAHHFAQSSGLSAQSSVTTFKFHFCWFQSFLFWLLVKSLVCEAG